MDIDKQYQTLTVLWFALMMNIGVIFLLLLFALPKNLDATATESSFWPSLILTLLSTLLVIFSFVVKRKLLRRAEVNQDVSLVKKALVIACAMCEAAALVGLAERILLRTNDYYFSFLIAMIGTALHFPRRDQLLVATYKGESREGLS